MDIRKISCRFHRLSVSHSFSASLMSPTRNMCAVLQYMLLPVLLLLQKSFRLLHIRQSSGQSVSLLRMHFSNQIHESVSHHILLNTDSFQVLHCCARSAQIACRRYHIYMLRFTPITFHIRFRRRAG